MRKYFLLFVVCITVVASFTGCTKTDGSISDPGQPAMQFPPDQATRAQDLADKAREAMKNRLKEAGEVSFVSDKILSDFDEKTTRTITTPLELQLPAPSKWVEIIAAVTAEMTKPPDAIIYGKTSDGWKEIGSHQSGTFRKDIEVGAIRIVPPAGRSMIVSEVHFGG